MTSQHLLTTYPPFGATLVRGKGAYLYDDQGKEYLDFLSGIAVTSLGHSNEEIAEVAARQFSTLQHVSNYFQNEYTTRVSDAINEKLTLKNPEVSGKVFFSNSGAEANECAIKIAKKFGEGKRYKFLTATGSFHGRTLATLAATGQPTKHAAFAPLPDFFKYFEFGNADSLRGQVDDECIAVIIEVMQGEGGVRVASPEFFTQVQDICKANGLLLIIDEIQTGMCRTGEWFGFHHFGLQPDIVTMAKALGNGMPVGACWSRDDIAECMNVGDHGSTFGGQPAALSIVDAVFAIMDRDDLVSRAATLGPKLMDALTAMNIFTEVRGRGLLVGADIDREKLDCDAPTFVKKCLEQGLIINATGENTLRFAPALIIDESHIDAAISVMEKASR